MDGPCRAGKDAAFCVFLDGQYSSRQLTIQTTEFGLRPLLLVRL